MSTFSNDELEMTAAGIGDLETGDLRRRYLELRGANLPKFLRCPLIILAALEYALDEGVSRYYTEQGHGFGFRPLLSASPT
jgi:hypothetical protein